MNTPNKARSAAGPDGLAGRVAAVTGAGRGLGRACAEALANAGTHVLLMSRTESELSKLENDIGRSGGKATALPCDVTDPHAVLDIHFRFHIRLEQIAFLKLDRTRKSLICRILLLIEDRFSVDAVSLPQLINVLYRDRFPGTRENDFSSVL